MDDDLAAYLRTALAHDPNSDEWWAVVRDVQRRQDHAAFETARALTESADPRERALGVNVLAQLALLPVEQTPADRVLVKRWTDEALPVFDRLADDPDPLVVSCTIAALGHHDDPRGLPAVLRHVASTDPEVRQTVVWALPSVAGDPPDPRAVDALVTLTTDPDAEVRDWATFGLSSLYVDSPAVREALWARVDDQEGDTDAEAAVGLARRQDPRALELVRSHLVDGCGNLWVEAAAELGDPRLLPDLLRLKESGWDEDEDEPRPALLDEAIEACRAGRGVSADDYEAIGVRREPPPAG